MLPLTMRALLLLLVRPRACSASSDWSAVDSLIHNFHFLPDVSFSAGNSHGRLHTFTKGKLNMQKQVILASSSKFPAALAIMGVVADPQVPLTFDTRINEVFDWWSTDPRDNRSLVTLRHLLTFTSGMVSNDFGNGRIGCLDTTPSSQASQVPYEACAVEIYYHGPWIAKPGSLWSYHSLHLQLAGAMAAKAAKMEVPDMLRKYLIDKLGMTSSYWIGNRGGTRDPNPHLAAALVSTGDDYDKILQAVLNYKIASKAIIDEAETDAYRTYPNLATAKNAKDTGLLFYGHYSMCLYFECVAQTWSEKCEKAGVHADPGLFGYWPLIDRHKGYYMQLVVERKVAIPPDIVRQYNVTKAMETALSAQCVAPLRFNLSDPVEKALGVASKTPPIVPSIPPLIKVLCEVS